MNLECLHAVADCIDNSNTQYLEKSFSSIASLEKFYNGETEAQSS